MQNKTKILKNVNWPSVFKVIKWLVPAFIALVLYKKFFKNPNVSLETLGEALSRLDCYWYLILLLFSLLNWGVETRKWQYLVCKLELQSFKIAFKSVLSGVAVSQLLPYRTGEYLGRLAYVKDANKISAGILSVAGSFSQLLITLIFGSMAFLVIQPIEVPVSFLVSSIALLILLVFGYFYLPQFRFIRESALVLALKEALGLLKKGDILRLLGFSFLRYLLFVLPYAIMIQVFPPTELSSVWYAMMAVACIFLLQTISPNFILTDLAIRVSVPALVLSGGFESAVGLEYVPGMMIYLFNLVLPMCIGAVILLSLKLRR